MDKNKSENVSELEAQIKNERDKLNLIFDSMIDGVYLISGDRRIQFMNKALRDRFGDHVGDICYQVFHGRDKPCPLCKLSEIMNRKKIRWEWHSPSTNRIYDLIETPVNGAGGTILKLTIFRDITRRKLDQKRVEEEYRRAEFYIDLMGHDINNINQVIMGYLDMLLSMPDFPEKFRNYTRIALDYVIKSAEIISNVKTLYELDSGGLDLKKIDIYPAFTSAVNVVRSHSRNVRVNSNIIKGTYFIHGNALLFNVFSNLLTNAVKFDKHDVVEIDVDISQSDDGRYWKLELKDKGKGIKDEYKKTIFNRLERAGENAHGSGLGLAIVKNIIESYKGMIWVEDRIKGDQTKGSNFIMLVPMEKDHKQCTLPC